MQNGWYSLETDPTVTGNLLQHAATRCNTLQHTATHCNTPQHTATHRNTPQHTATHRNKPQNAATQTCTSEAERDGCYWNTLQHAATHCNTLQRKHAPSKLRDTLKLMVLQHTTTLQRTVAHAPQTCTFEAEKDAWTHVTLIRTRKFTISNF